MNIIQGVFVIVSVLRVTTWVHCSVQHGTGVTGLTESTLPLTLAVELGSRSYHTTVAY